MGLGEKRRYDTNIDGVGELGSEGSAFDAGKYR